MSIPLLSFLFYLHPLPSLYLFYPSIFIHFLSWCPLCEIQLPCEGALGDPQCVQTEPSWLWQLVVRYQLKITLPVILLLKQKFSHNQITKFHAHCPWPWNLSVLETYWHGDGMVLSQPRNCRHGIQSMVTGLGTADKWLWQGPLVTSLLDTIHEVLSIQSTIPHWQDFNQ